MIIRRLFIFLSLLCGLIQLDFAEEWVRQEIIYPNEITDGVLADLNKDGLLDILVISGNFICVNIQTEKGFNKIPDDRIYFKELGEYIDVGEVDSKYPGLEILGISGNVMKYYYFKDGHFRESPNYFVLKEMSRASYKLGSSLSDFAFDINNDGQDEIFFIKDNRFFYYTFDSSGKYNENELPSSFEMATVSLESKQLTNENSLKTPYDLSYFFRPKISVEKIAILQDLNSDGLLDIISREPYIQGPNFKFNALNQAILGKIHPPKRENQEIFLDINGDKRLDKILIQIKDIFSGNLKLFPEATFLIYINHNQNDFSPKPDYLFKTVLIGDAFPFLDVDTDGNLDFISIWPDISPGSKENIIQVFTGHTIKFTLRCYLFNNDVGFPPNPNLIYKFKIKYNDLSDILDYDPFDFSGDFNGDGKNDLLVRSEPDYMYIYKTSLEKNKSFADSSRIKIPKDADHFKVIDLNKDGKSDIVVFIKKKISIFLNNSL